MNIHFYADNMQNNEYYSRSIEYYSKSAIIIEKEKT